VYAITTAAKLPTGPSTDQKALRLWLGPFNVVPRTLIEHSGQTVHLTDRLGQKKAGTVQVCKVTRIAPASEQKDAGAV